MEHTEILSRCLDCGRAEIDPQGPEYAGPSTLTEVIHCDACGATFRQTFKVTATERIKEGGGQ